jgi:hypothetical protein
MKLYIHRKTHAAIVAPSVMRSNPVLGSPAYVQAGLDVPGRRMKFS